MQRPGSWVYRRWWEQEGLDLTGERNQAAAAEDREEERGIEEGGQEKTTDNN